MVVSFTNTWRSLGSGTYDLMGLRVTEKIELLYKYQ